MVGKKSLIALSITAVVVLVATVSSYAYAFREMKGLQIKLEAQERVEQQKFLETVVNDTVTPESTKKSQESTYTEQKPALKPQPVQSAPVQQKAQTEAQVYQGAHIPFTNEPVTPGVPESYVDTVGQCPFYEMAGEKGCYPPADIECNADWTQCQPKEVNTDEAN